MSVNASPKIALTNISEVLVLTDSTLLSFKSVGDSFLGPLWTNPVKSGSPIVDEELLQLLQGYESAGCVVMPISLTEDKPSDILPKGYGGHSLIPEDCVKVVIRDSYEEIKKAFLRIRGESMNDGSPVWKVRFGGNSRFRQEDVEDYIGHKESEGCKAHYFDEEGDEFE